MIYLALARHQWIRFGRSLEGKRLWLIGLGLVPVLIYGTFVLVGLGLFFDQLLAPLVAEAPPVHVLDAHLLSAWAGMLGLRFFFQRPPRLEIRSYLHLPVERRHLLRYFQGASLLSLHNLYPLLFFVPFWVKHVLPETPLHGALAWAAGIGLCLVASSYLTTWLRRMVDRHGRIVLLTAVAFVLFHLMDQSVGPGLVTAASSRVFDALAAGNLAVLAMLALGAAGTVWAAGRALRQSLREDPDARAAGARLRLLPGTLRFGNAPMANLIVLEVLLMWRNRRTRQYVLISVGVSTLYTALLLSDFNALAGGLMAAVIGLFASGVFALNYGQLMFAWESRYFDGLLARDIPPRHLVLAKFMVLQGSCLLLVLLSLPLFVWLAPELLMLHVAFLFYNAGVTSLLMLTLAVFNRRRVNAAEGSFFNYQGFSIMHWLWILPTIIPPALLLWALEGRPETALSLIATVGLVSMLMAWPSSSVLSFVLARRKHQMAAGFRSHDR